MDNSLNDRSLSRSGALFASLALLCATAGVAIAGNMSFIRSTVAPFPIFPQENGFPLLGPNSNPAAVLDEALLKSGWPEEWASYHAHRMLLIPFDRPLDEPAIPDHWPDGSEVVLLSERSNPAAVLDEAFLRSGWPQEWATYLAYRALGRSMPHPLSLPDIPGMPSGPEVAEIENWPTEILEIIQTDHPKAARLRAMRLEHGEGENAGPGGMQCAVYKIRLSYCNSLGTRPVLQLYMNAVCWENVVQPCLLLQPECETGGIWVSATSTGECDGLPEEGECMMIRAWGHTTIPCDDIDVYCNCFEETDCNDMEFDCCDVTIGCNCPHDCG